MAKSSETTPKPTNTTKKLVTILIATITIALLLWCVYVVSMWYFNRDGLYPEGVSDEPPKVTLNPNLIPSVDELRITMGEAANDLYGEENLEEIFLSNDTFEIPNTNIKLDSSYLTDTIELMAVTALAFERNPYAVRTEHPDTYKQLLGYDSKPIREMPDGTMIDLSTIEESYTDINFLIRRGNPAKITVEGYVNGDYFSQEVDLNPYYQVQRAIE